MKISIKYLLVAVCVLLVSIPVVILGIASYSTMEAETFNQIEERLEQQASELKLFSESVYSEVHANKDAVEVQARSMISSQAEAVYNFVNSYSDNENKLFEAIGKIKVGETGYIYVMDYKGNMIYHPANAALIGTNMYNTPDKKGFLFIKDQVDNGQRVYGRDVFFSKYVWRNSDNEDFRDKIAGVLNVESKGWLIVISTYYDELIDANYEANKLNSFKDQLSDIVVGKTGYIFILDMEGNYVLSAARARDGENIWTAKDSNGNLFIQEMIEKGKKLSSAETGVQYYPWKNEGDSKARMKLAGYAYIPEWEWLIASSAYQDDFLDGLKNVRNMTFTISIISIIIGCGIAILFAIAISNPLGHIDRVIKKVAAGDLTEKVKVSSSITELKNLSDNFDSMVDKVSGLIGQVARSSDLSASSAEELSASSEEVNSSMEQVSSTIQEIAKGSQNVSGSATGAQDASKKTLTSAQTGGKLAQEIKDKMSKISETTDAGSDKISALGAKSEKISEIIETINNVSEQTNLLALNAAIEAARAGEAGRGFAVVADEVRKLAEESQKATASISELIGDIQNEIKGSVESMTSISDEVKAGSESVENALSAFNEIPTLVGNVDKSLSEVSAVAEENAAGSEEVSASVEEVTSSMQQVANTSQELAKAAEDLKKIVGQFKISSSFMAKDKTSTSSSSDMDDLIEEAKKEDAERKKKSGN